MAQIYVALVNNSFFKRNLRKLLQKDYESNKYNELFSDKERALQLWSSIESNINKTVTTDYFYCILQHVDLAQETNRKKLLGILKNYPNFAAALAGDLLSKNEKTNKSYNMLVKFEVNVEQVKQIEQAKELTITNLKKDIQFLVDFFSNCKKANPSPEVLLDLLPEVKIKDEGNNKFSFDINDKAALDNICNEIEKVYSNNKELLNYVKRNYLDKNRTIPDKIIYLIVSREKLWRQFYTPFSFANFSAWWTSVSKENLCEAPVFKAKISNCKDFSISPDEIKKGMPPVPSKQEITPIRHVVTPTLGHTNSHQSKLVGGAVFKINLLNDLSLRVLLNPRTLLSRFTKKFTNPTVPFTSTATNPQHKKGNTVLQIQSAEHTQQTLSTNTTMSLQTSPSKISIRRFVPVTKSESTPLRSLLSEISILRNSYKPLSVLLNPRYWLSRTTEKFTNTTALPVISKAVKLQQRKNSTVLQVQGTEQTQQTQFSNASDNLPRVKQENVKPKVKNENNIPVDKESESAPKIKTSERLETALQEYLHTVALSGVLDAFVSRNKEEEEQPYTPQRKRRLPSASISSDFDSPIAPASPSGSLPSSGPASPSGSLPSSTPTSPSGSLPSSAPTSPSGSLPSSAPASPSGSLPSSAPASPTSSLPSSEPASPISSLPSSEPASPISSLPSSATTSPNGSLPSSEPASPISSLPSSATTSPNGSLPSSATTSPNGSLPSSAASSPNGTLPSSPSGIYISPFSPPRRSSPRTPREHPSGVEDSESRVARKLIFNA
jgi:hypothetical protein